MSAPCTKGFAYQQGMLYSFNRVLLEKGIISEKEYRAMKQKIQLRERGEGIVARSGQK
ncbi:hypothetical protein JQM68_00270 [Oscillibacter valericigenes]|uniref:hypothetical protein n=1 Tax=Oscillibacter valericigenes TaxID=351091 RepID=UPI001F2A3E4D|nr:hypothetical protein [Oscillibacter valericigenes]MCF2615629.1 hypothetical protein [Oscillibacter valericigenes]